jgi:hypothetical protein
MISGLVARKGKKKKKCMQGFGEKNSQGDNYNTQD